MSIANISYKRKALYLKTQKERDLYVQKRIKNVCSIVSREMLSYIKRKKLTKMEFSIKTNISKYRLNRILEGEYGSLSLRDIASISSELSGVRDIGTRIILIEKTQ